MPPEDVPRNQSPADAARVATDDGPGSRTPPEDAADYPRTDTGSPPYAEGGPPGATGTGGPDGARIEAAPEVERAETGRAETGRAETAEAGSTPTEAREGQTAGEAETARHAAEEEPQAEELAPGEVPVESSFEVWELETTDGFRDRWQQIQLRFIDDPRHATEQAQSLLGDVIDALADGLRRQRGEVDRWRDAELDDTEELRVTVRRYRNLLDRLLSM